MKTHPQRNTRARRAALVLGWALSCASCVRDAAPPAPSRAGAVRVLMSSDPASLTLIGKSDKNTEWLAVQITDSLVQYDARLQLVPRLAQSWEVSDDRTLLTFHLRNGVRWHDGRPVTADDVVYSVRKVREPAVDNRSMAPLFLDLLDVEAPDALTVRARYRRLSADALDAWRVPIVPRHLVERDPDLLTGEFSRHPVGCGPFRFVRYERGVEVVLEANDDYWDGRPAIDGLVFRIFPEQRTALQALLTGELDLMIATPELWAEARAAPGGERLTAAVSYPLGLWHVGFNQDGSNPFFGDARVRRALLMALDRAQVRDTLAGGLARVAVTSYHPELPWTDRTLEPWPHDPALARQLLEQAGWRDQDGDGVRERDGRPFRFKLMIASSMQKLVDHLAAWQQQAWADIGVQVDIEKLEFQQFRERRNAHEFEAVEGTLLFTPIADQFELYHSSARASGINWVGFSDAAVDRLLEQGRSTFDPAARIELYHALQRRLHELQPIACLFHFSRPVLHDARLAGLAPTALDEFRISDGPRTWRWTGR